MKYIVFIVISTVSLGLFGQKKIDLFFDEFCVSSNKSNVYDNNTDNKYGFGLSVYHSFRSDKTMNIIFGWEYNRVSQLKNYVYEGHFSHLTDVTYNTNYLSFPLGLRLNFGTRSKLILEVGGFADLSTGGKRFGTCHSYIPDENYVVTYKEFQFEEKGGLPSLAAANKPAYLMSLSRRMLLIVRQNFKIILPLVIISR